jgi:DDE family transposase/integrase-like protein
VVVRADAAFAKPEIYEALEQRGVNYAIRIPANENLERDIAELLPRPVGRPSSRPLVEYKSFLYQAGSWKKAGHLRLPLMGASRPCSQSPAATGPAGPLFEGQVGAYYLVSMLAGGSFECFRDRVIEFWCLADRTRGFTPRCRSNGARALSEKEQSAVLACLHEERFQDCSPTQVYAALLDEGRFHCSIRTMYRLLETKGENRERRDQLTHPPYQKPELLATQANQLWSWDITKLRGPVKWTVYHLYVILDVFSRYVVGWMIAHRESAELAKRLIQHSCRAQNIVSLFLPRFSCMEAVPAQVQLIPSRTWNESQFARAHRASRLHLSRSRAL